MGEGAPSSGTGAGRALRWLGIAAGTVGALACLAALVVLLVVRGRVVERVDRVEERLDAAAARAAAPLAAARERVDALSARVAELRASLRERASEEVAERLAALRERLDDFAERREAWRAAYADAREKVVAVLERLEAIDDAFPAVSLPSGPRDVLADVDAKVREVDAGLGTWLVALRGEGASPAAEPAPEREGVLAAALSAVSERLRELAARVERLRGAVAERAAGVRGTVTLSAVALAVAALWLAFLHVVLVLWSRPAVRAAGKEPTSRPPRPPRDR